MGIKLLNICVYMPVNVGRINSFREIGDDVSKVLRIINT